MKYILLSLGLAIFSGCSERRFKPGECFTEEHMLYTKSYFVLTDDGETYSTLTYYTDMKPYAHYSLSVGFVPKNEKKVRCPIFTHIAQDTIPALKAYGLHDTWKELIHSQEGYENLVHDPAMQ